MSDMDPIHPKKERACAIPDRELLIYKQQNVRLRAALADMLPLALSYLQGLCLNDKADDDDTDDGLPAPAKWELSRRYYSALAALKEAES